MDYYKDKITSTYLSSNILFTEHASIIKENNFFQTLAFNIFPQYLIYFYLLFNFSFEKYESSKSQDDFFVSKVVPSADQQKVRDELTKLGNKHSGNFLELSKKTNIEKKLKEWLSKYLFHIDDKGSCVQVVGLFPKLEDISEIFFYFNLIFLGISKDPKYSKVGSELSKLMGSFLSMKITLTNISLEDIMIK